MKHLTEKEKKDFDHAEKIWKKYAEKEALFHVTCWEGNPIHSVKVVLPPDAKKAPRKPGFFPEIGFFGIGSLWDGKKHISVGLNSLKEV